MNGMTVFRTIGEALRQGYEVVDRVSWGYVVRTRTANGYALAIVDQRDDHSRWRPRGADR